MNVLLRGDFMMVCGFSFLCVLLIALQRRTIHTDLLKLCVDCIDTKVRSLVTFGC